MQHLCGQMHAPKNKSQSLCSRFHAHGVATPLRSFSCAGIKINESNKKQCKQSKATKHNEKHAKAIDGKSLTHCLHIHANS